MTKYRFLNASNILLKITRKVLIFSIFLLAVISVHDWIIYFFPNINKTFILLLSSLIWIIIFRFFYNLIPEFKNPSLRHFQSTLLEARTKFHLCESYVKIMKSLENTFIIKLHLQNVKLFLVRKKYADIKIPIYVEDKFTLELKKFNNILVKDEIDFLDIPKSTKNLFKKNLEKLDASICLALYYENNLFWLFILWSKLWESLYSKEEIEEIQKMKDKLEICFFNILLKKRLQQENNLMKKIIQEKTKNLTERNKEIKQIIKQQSDFISIAAHEFRTPLSAALFQVEDTLENYKDSSEVSKDINVLWDSLENLKKLTQKLFEVQQINLKKIKLTKTKIKIYDILESIYNEFKTICEKKSINIQFINSIDKDTKIKIDEIRIRQVISNILSNAVKFVNENEWKIIRWET